MNHWRAQGKGEGVDSNAAYIFKGGTQEEPPPDPENPNGGSAVWSEKGPHLASTSTRYMSLIGKGQTPNYRMRCIFHTTINANGEMVTEFERCSIPCE